ncbi:hypothetical protein IQ16_07607 [Bradyrhizobium huanghuaihaiense]|uniref:Uncharacterized protein n=1 Tax=Bradyrhizobium huanghuaihaiense TaxID=990078 RepID=A0A562QUP9_9BRAD|nr:hypothetical protein [Bradyrhizobium huanghuaihaiense]TWI60487.1 hypothetical protein IQ16_07607 [Bradyrhizobium huanghuaihaiense]
MAGHRYRRRYHKHIDIGHERARQHIEDAKRLTAELGGTDQDVKEYFFSLSPRSLTVILDAYEQQYGSGPRAYAQSTIAKWKTGAVHMSGTVAERLFRLLPPRMPLQEKYKLIENLWTHVGPKSRKVLKVGLNGDIQQIIDVIRGHMNDVVVRYAIPTSLEKRFEWLCAGDSRAKQDFLNHFLEHEKTFVVEGARRRIPVLLEHLRSSTGANTHRAAEVLKIGNHELEVTLDPSATGVCLEEPYVERSWSTRTSTEETSYWWVLWVLGAIVVLYALSHR